MAEPFYGPWSVAVIQADVAQTDGFPEHSFVISGSDNADGRYMAHPHQPPVMVTGAEWTIDVEVRSIGSEAPWAPVSRVRRATEFVPFSGLTVTLNSRPASAGWGGPYHFGVILTCTSNDPSINPIPTATPYDFTIPGH
jgi:hypothetical protein